MEEGRLIFTIQNDTHKVISINLDELRVPISFEEYFNQYISKDILFILDENYNENTILILSLMNVNSELLHLMEIIMNMFINSLYIVEMNLKQQLQLIDIIQQKMLK